MKAILTLEDVLGLRKAFKYSVKRRRFSGGEL
jgi:hypothetical protein